ncbi:MAG TPA: VCBS repeat-containing protein, partial [Gemmataceae bacterium]|nr:VCBS repeat-containing protein [Gemmataceae bacterium]
MFANWLRSLTRRPTTTRRGFRPALEALEGRTVPTTLTNPAAFAPSTLLSVGGPSSQVVAVAAVDVTGTPASPATPYPVALVHNPGAYDQVVLPLGDAKVHAPLVYGNLGSTGGAGALAVGDFTGDGRADIAVVEPGTMFGQIDLLVNQGDGTFKLTTSFAPTNAVQSAVAADFTNSGRPGLVVTGPGGISVVRTDANNVFSGSQLQSSPGTVAVGDFNGDGKLDLSVAAYDPVNGWQVRLLLGNGNG